MTTINILICLTIAIFSLVLWIYNACEVKFPSWLTWFAAFVFVISLLSFFYHFDQWADKGSRKKAELLNSEQVIFFGEQRSASSLPLVQKTIVIDDGADITYWVLPVH